MNGIHIALSVLTQLSVAIQEIAALIGMAQSQGRDITPEEIKAVNDKYEASFAGLRKAIEDAEGAAG